MKNNIVFFRNIKLYTTLEPSNKRFNTNEILVSWNVKD